ncbi:MAG TPA: tetratricopeptide repeat protein [Fimbriimonas sp.]|nr:tetratricopeptide repeat protein [Fimbriimonas sp.]
MTPGSKTIPTVFAVIGLVVLVGAVAYFRVPRMRANALNNEGLKAYHSANYPLAKQKFEQAIQVMPRMSGAHASLGMVLSEMGQYDAAKQELEKAIQISPKRPGPYESLWLIDITQKSYNAALVDSQRAVQAIPGDPLLWVDLATSEEKVGQIDQSVRDCKHAVDLAPAKYTFRNTYGLILVRAHRRKEAREQWQFVIQNSTDSARDRASRYLERYPENPAPRSLTH